MPPLKFTLRETDAHAEGYALILSHCFARPLDEGRKWVKRYDREHTCLLVDPRDDSPDGVAAGLVLIDMGHSYGGRFVPGMGIAGVGVAPRHRGRGTATLLMDRTVQHLHRHGIALSGLYPATQALYRRSGYEQAGHRCLLRTPLHRIDSRERTLPIRPATPEDTPEIERLYESWSASTDGALKRYEGLWRRARMIPPAREEGALAFVIESESTSSRTRRSRSAARPRLEGYVYMHMPQGPDGRPELHVNDMVAITPRAGRRLWSFLASHSTICTDLVWHCTPAHPLLTLLPEQSFKLSLHMYWMLRVVDAPAALEGRGYSAGLDAELALDLTDPLVKANNGRFVASVHDGRAVVRRDRHRSSRAPRLALDINTLATLYSGFQPAPQLRLLDRLRGDDRAIDTGAAIFGGQTPGMCEMF